MLLDQLCWLSASCSYYTNFKVHFVFLDSPKSVYGLHSENVDGWTPFLERKDILVWRKVSILVFLSGRGGNLDLFKINPPIILYKVNSEIIENWYY